MIRPLFCGTQHCTPIDRNGKNGLMRSIEKDFSRDHETCPSNLLKQKKSLKHIISKHHKQPKLSHFKIDPNHHEQALETNIFPSQHTNHLHMANFERSKANNTVSQYGQYQQNRRNLLNFNTNQNQQPIYRPTNYCPQTFKPLNVSHAASNKPSFLSRHDISLKGPSEVRNAPDNKNINLYKSHQLKLLPTYVDSSKAHESHPHKENFLNYSSVQEIQSLKNSKGPFKPPKHFQLSHNCQPNQLISTKRHNLVRKSDIIRSIHSPQHSNQQIYKNYVNSNLTYRSPISNSNSHVNICQLKETLVYPHYQPKHFEKLSKYKVQKIVTEPQPHALQKGQSYEPLHRVPSNINQALQILKLDSKVVQCETRSHGKSLTRQNSKSSMVHQYNPKFSMLTSNTNDSHSSPYQNQKSFQNRFNPINFNQSTPFGMHSQFKQPNSNPWSVLPHSNRSIPIKIGKSEPCDNKQNQSINSSSKSFSDKSSDENKTKYPLKRNIKKRTTLQAQTSDCTNVEKQKFGQFNRHQNLQISQMPNINHFAEHSGHQARNKKKRSSFFLMIETNRFRNTLEKNKQDPFLNTNATQEQNTDTERRDQLSMLNVKNAESFINSQGSSSQQDSELEYVVHSSSNVKLKSFALLKSLHAERKDSIKFES